jgi:hypothetical protein
MVEFVCVVLVFVSKICFVCVCVVVENKLFVVEKIKFNFSKRKEEINENELIDILG